MSDGKGIIMTIGEKISTFTKSARRFVRSQIMFVAKIAGSPSAFILSLGAVIIWCLTGPYFNFSDTWQLVINTGTTIITFLMAFTIQYTQNRDTKQITMILKSLMKQNKALRDQLEAIEQEMDEED